ncbi:symmetrical bis(5'-nucleosyl)-tetraphosphatase [Methylomonas sp. LL1]|uniref:symmetrical bis(5'-nucleosyl)-tetraphosphatase n=1 Tax=Methylomonas sp. LL1 TaxID=2785785 RepID=UPI0018C3B093|nr:symmetrical bis(5'-nucleosyl)-tetraphosphatase [Methylomonas sp. LL1]QPK62260.1 symmetrical bis(5'-nucleosyl)-tetraphosphatase [Methylomonas sp. LL1]CAG1021060.1 bis(5'-nucleosyl)-tetraphosphatase (symmetrical) [Methylococcales bacterium]
MAIYAIGDIQGCYNELRRLLDVIKFDPDQDQLWLAGDLVNRGPHSLETLRFVKSLGDSAITVLGNHDLHLIATVASLSKTGKKDTLGPILRAADCDELIDWLRNQPLFYHNDQFCMLHAGLPPQWDFEQTKTMASETEQAIRGEDYQRFFRSMYGNKPTAWQDDLPKTEKLRFAVNCFTRLRYCTADGELDFHHKGPPGSQAGHLLPWFAVPGRKSRDMCIIFGHWSTLGFYQEHNVYSIDTGCLWGGQLTALRLDQPAQRISIDCQCVHKPSEL